MTELEQIAELSPEDIAKLREERAGKVIYGGLIFLTAALLIFAFLLANYLNSLIFMAIFILLALSVSGFLFNFAKKMNTLIDQDILGGRKNIIIAPIQSKRIDSSEITHGREKGGISSKYYMTIKGREYDMTERRYLMIKVGEFMEIHEAPLSKTILKQRWLKEDDSDEVENDTTDN